MKKSDEINKQMLHQIRLKNMRYFTRCQMKINKLLNLMSNGKYVKTKISHNNQITKYRKSGI